MNMDQIIASGESETVDSLARPSELTLFSLVITSALGARIDAYIAQFVPTPGLLGLFSIAVLFAGGRVLKVQRQNVFWGSCSAT